MEENQRLCKDCINYLMFKDDKTECDFDHFNNINIYRSYIYIPEQFDCDDYEVVK